MTDYHHFIFDVSMGFACVQQYVHNTYYIYIYYIMRIGKGIYGALVRVKIPEVRTFSKI